MLRATDVSQLKREKRKKLSGDAATDGDFGAFVFLSDVVWTDHVEDDGQRKIAAS